MGCSHRHCFIHSASLSGPYSAAGVDTCLARPFIALLLLRVPAIFLSKSFEGPHPAAGVDTCLAGPFIAAEAAGRPEAAAALAQAWLAYLAASQACGGMEEPQLVDLAVKVRRKHHLPTGCPLCSPLKRCPSFDSSGSGREGVFRC